MWSADPPVVKDSKKDGPARAGVARVPKAATTSEEAGRGKQVSRTAMVHTIFQVLDEGNTGLLGSKAMRRFAVLNGFEGSVADWEAEFRMICGEWGISGDGFGEASFQQLVNDESEKGCFCNNQELWSIAVKLVPREQLKALVFGPERISSRSHGPKEKRPTSPSHHLCHSRVTVVSHQAPLGDF